MPQTGQNATLQDACLIKNKTDEKKDLTRTESTNIFVLNHKSWPWQVKRKIQTT